METPYGRIRCTMKGVPKAERPIILTMHDIGLNRKPRLSHSALSLSVVCQASLIWIPPRQLPVATSLAFKGPMLQQYLDLCYYYNYYFLYWTPVEKPHAINYKTNSLDLQKNVVLLAKTDALLDLAHVAHEPRPGCRHCN